MDRAVMHCGSGWLNRRFLKSFCAVSRQGAAAGPHSLHGSSRGPAVRRVALNQQDLPRAVVHTAGGTFVRQPRSSGNAVSDLLFKLQLCFHIFFPEKPKDTTPKEEVKRRLKMVLVADRCGMSPGSLGELKKTIAKALQDFVDIESEDAIEVQINDDPGLGTVYCVAIPVRRVKAETRFASDGRVETGADGVLLEWDPTDLHSDPSSRFPMGC
ncbi:Cell division topological specificity factor, chloroplastic [Pleodorina starrii]|uniref:Cell division topological specificity factor, chloroplastic n=1 Tax=Pleodorina starrii TaxID=330485 RepID=A0A9W6BZU8_9CHLO|nr:Cell division topological specificity factor [Pleodorina starrii]GLC60820.1 Cell division topological specificity factor, chloroplastic [Pleodorina starrii]GLC66731.1 Cell division topological specificity factor [Pleodorina starrii]